MAVAGAVAGPGVATFVRPRSAVSLAVFAAWAVGLVVLAFLLDVPAAQPGAAACTRWASPFWTR